MRTYGLIGYPLGHSFSQSYFAQKFERENATDAVYKRFEVADLQLLPDLLRDTSLSGLNVTIPYKTAIIPFLDELDVMAKAVGAVNTIKFKIQNSKINTVGYNTDIIGFKQSLLPLLKPTHTKALVFGTGGASKAVCYVLQQLGIAYTLVGRDATQGGMLYQDLTAEILQQHLLLINTTPVGTFPDVNTYLSIPYTAITSQHVVYDLVYNPTETMFLQKAKAQGAVVKNGLEMLYLQAEAAWHIWNT